MGIKIETERLTLREFVPEDASVLISIAKQPHIEHWLPDWAGFHRWAVDWINKARKNYKIDNPQKEFIALAVDVKDKKQMIGQIGIGGHDNGIGVCYFMSDKFTGKGYTSEAMKAFIEYAFKKYGYDHLIATVQPENAASNRVVQKLGFFYLSTIMMLDNGQTEELPFHFYRLDNPYVTLQK